MFRSAAVLALLLCAPLAAAQSVTAELPVADLRLVPGPYTACAVFSGATKAFAVCNVAGGGQPYRYDLAPDGQPILSSRTPVVGQAFAGVGDALFYATLSVDAIAVRRFGNDAEARVDAKAPSQPMLISNGGGSLLLIYASGGTMMGTIVDTDLQVTARPFAIMPAASWTRAASAGGGFLIAGHDSAGVVTAVIVDAAGRVHPMSLPVPRLSFDAVASNGNEYLYLWQSDRTPLAAQRYSPAGEAIGDLQVIAQSASGNLFAPGAVWTGSDYLLTWAAGNDGWMRMLSGAPQSLGKGLPSAAAGPSGTYLTISPPNMATTIRRLDTGGAEHVLSYNETTQWSPALVVDGLEAAVVWNEAGDVDSNLRFGRIGADGTRRDGPGIALPMANVHPSIASDGTNRLIVWMADNRIQGLFVTRDSRAGAPFIIGEETHNQWPAVAWTGTKYIVTWQAGAFGFNVGAEVTPAGVVTPFLLSGTAFETIMAAGPRTLVVSAYDGPGYVMKLSAGFLETPGFSYDLAQEPQGGDAFYSTLHAVSNGRDYLVAWTRHRAHHAEAWIARIDASGKIIGQPLQVATSDASWYGASAVPLFDGTSYRVVVGGDAGQALFVATVGDATFDCRCLDDRVDVPIDFDIAAAGHYFEAAASREAIVIAYERTYPHDLPRVFLRFVRTPPPRRRAAR